MHLQPKQKSSAEKHSQYSFRHRLFLQWQTGRRILGDAPGLALDLTPAVGVAVASSAFFALFSLPMSAFLSGGSPLA